MTRPRLLDRYCGAGGAARGYQRAGFYVVGVDHKPQPRYAGDEFILADALTFPADGFDAQHASPPCQRYSRGTRAHNRSNHPDLVAPTRALLQAGGIPWVMENVPGAPVRPDVKLCACMFGMQPLKRERWFETCPVLADLRQPCYHPGGSISINRRGGRYNGPGPQHDKYISLARCQELMGIDWMIQNELGEAIPPIYTEYLGRQLLHAIAGGS